MSDSHDSTADNATEQLQLPPTSGLTQIVPRQTFSRKEEDLMLKYIVYHSLYDKLRMMSMWKDMAKYFNNGRTAESLRERFRRFVIPQIYVYDIPNDKKNLITVGFAMNVQTRKGRNDMKQE